jgi:hypothetical protein
MMEAVKTIQRHFKGYQMRKNVKNLPTMSSKLSLPDGNRKLLLHHVRAVAYCTDFY